MCVVCKELRYHVDFCPTCFVGICWNTPGLTCAFRTVGAFVHSVQMLEDGAGEEEVALFTDTVMWPPVWLYPIPSLHDDDIFIGFPAEALPNGVPTISQEAIDSFGTGITR